MKKKHMIAKKDMSESSLEMEDMKWNKNHVSTGPLHNLGKLEIFLFFVRFEVLDIYTLVFNNFYQLSIHLSSRVL